MILFPLFLQVFVSLCIPRVLEKYLQSLSQEISLIDNHSTFTKRLPVSEHTFDLKFKHPRELKGSKPFIEISSDKEDFPSFGIVMI